MAKASMLLVEDDAALAELLAYHFRREDFDVRHTPDGEEALLLAREATPHWFPRSPSRRWHSEPYGLQSGTLWRMLVEVNYLRSHSFRYVEQHPPHPQQVVLIPQTNIISQNTPSPYHTTWKP